MNNIKYTLNIPMNGLVVFFKVIGRTTKKFKYLRRNWFVIEIARLAEASVFLRAFLRFLVSRVTPMRRGRTLGLVQLTTPIILDN